MAVCLSAKPPYEKWGQAKHGLGLAWCGFNKSSQVGWAGFFAHRSASHIHFGGQKSVATGKITSYNKYKPGNEVF
jgi:hypothetical protein